MVSSKESVKIEKRSKDWETWTLQNLKIEEITSKGNEEQTANMEGEKLGACNVLKAEWEKCIKT